MNTRKAFEAWSTEWIEEDCPSMKEALLEREGDTYAQAIQRMKWKVWQAATNAALERAAMACESLGMTTSGIYERNHECASAIRALKDEK